MFKRKVYDKLSEWKEKYSDRYAVLLEGARRVGKSTVAEEFAKQEYASYIVVNFANITDELLEVFDDIANLDFFFLRLQTVTGVKLIAGKSVIIFDEIQMMPKVRQAIKHLVKDGRYHYIETVSLISIKKNVKDILIPSEEMKIQVYPMDYEEFLWACGKESFDLLRQIATMNKPIGNATNRALMRDFRIYMAVGGMPQAVEAYVQGKTFSEIDVIKRGIIDLYKDDFRKIDSSGRISAIFDSIPRQLAQKKKRFVLSRATGKRITRKDEELLYDLLDSKTVLCCYNVTQASVALSQGKDFDTYKLYLADVGLFTTMLFNDESQVYEKIYSKLLSDKLDANLGFLYENAVAQIIRSCGRELYYHTWNEKDNVHSYEIDFLVSSKGKIVPIEVKSSDLGSHTSINIFSAKYSKVISRRILFSQKDIGNEEMLELKPMYLAPVLMEEL